MGSVSHIRPGQFAWRRPELPCCAKALGMVAVLGEIHRCCPLPGQQPACHARLGTGAGVCRRDRCPAQPTGVPHLAAESRWPLQIITGDTTLTLYQPQLDSWDGYKLSARIAV